MKYNRPEVLLAFENARSGERVEIITKDSTEQTIGHVVGKSPCGYYDYGWCIKLKLEREGALRFDEKQPSIEIFREKITSFKFLREEKDLQLSLPFEENQPYLLLI